jgi:hypothetical protein
MYAAPTAEADFTILVELRKRSWKDQLIYLDQLQLALPSHPEPEILEFCFLEML